MSATVRVPSSSARVLSRMGRGKFGPALEHEAGNRARPRRSEPFGLGIRGGPVFLTAWTLSTISRRPWVDSGEQRYAAGSWFHPVTSKPARAAKLEELVGPIAVGWFGVRGRVYEGPGVEPRTAGSEQTRDLGQKGCEVRGDLVQEPGRDDGVEDAGMHRRRQAVGDEQLEVLGRSRRWTKGAADCGVRRTSRMTGQLVEPRGLSPRGAAG